MNVYRRFKQSASRFVKSALSEAAASSGIYRIAANKYGGVGVILTLHRVATPGAPILYPGYLIHADVLDWILGATRRMGWEIIDLDQMTRRLEQNDYPGRFACFTIDDGYLDNLQVALPVFRKHRAPFAVYLCTGLLDRSVFYWWGGLDQLVRTNVHVEYLPPGASTPRVLPARTWEEKRRTYDTLDRLCHEAGPGPAQELFTRYGIDARAVLDRDAMTIDQAKDLAADPLVTIGAHCITHERLSHMADADSSREIRDGKQTLERWLGVDVRHLAYPFGGPSACGQREATFAAEAGYRTAVTTRRGNIFPEHHCHLHLLPRRTVPTSRTAFRNTMSGVESFFRREPVFRTA
jgi:peptidoglycan/xylan/chitin deacetylase (PgdA/CDA1 family)